MKNKNKNTGKERNGDTDFIWDLLDELGSAILAAGAKTVYKQLKKTTIAGKKRNK